MNTNKKEVIRDDLLLKDEVYAIVGVAIDVHNELGAGFLEAAYQEAMEIETGIRSIPFKPQCDLNIQYKGRQLKKDFVCFDEIVVEIKAMRELAVREERNFLTI